MTALHTSELLHGGFTPIGFKMGFTAHPISTFFGNGALSQFVFKLDFKVGAVKTAFAFGFWDMKFASLLVEFISDFVGNKGGRGKNKVQ